MYKILLSHSIDHDKEFNKHIQPRHWLVRFILVVWNAVESSSHLLCYFAVFFNAAYNLYDSISIIPVIMVLFWGQLSVPRPTKTFWVVLITYMQVKLHKKKKKPIDQQIYRILCFWSQVTGLVKYICSFKEIPWTHEETKIRSISSSSLYSYPTMKIGIGNYTNKIPTDLIVLLVLFIHR